MSIKETEAGGEFASVTMSDLNGSIPSMVKNKISTRQAKSQIGMINFMLTGEKLAE